MIYVLTAIAMLLTIRLGMRVWGLRGAAVGLSDRLAISAFPSAFLVAVVGLIYCVLSWPVVRVALNQVAIGTLRSLDEGLPDWALFFAKENPLQWQAMLGFAIAALVAGVVKSSARAPAWSKRLANELQRPIDLFRGLGNWVNGVAAALFMAAAFTLFGTQLASLKSEVRTQLQQAEALFNRATNRFAQDLAVEVANQTIEAVRNATHPSAAVARAVDAALQRTAAATRIYAAGTDVSPSKARAQLWALEVSAAVSDMKPAGSTVGDRSLDSIEADEVDLRFRDGISRRSLYVASPGEESKGLHRESREAAKEVLNAFADRVKEHFDHDPVLRLFAEVTAPVITEVAADLATRGHVAAMLEKIWVGLDGGKDWRALIKSEANNLVARLNANRHWERLDATKSGLVDGKGLHYIVDAAKGLEQAPSPETASLSSDLRRFGVLAEPVTFTPLTLPAQAEQQAFDGWRKTEASFSLDEARRVVALLERLGMSDAAQALSANLNDDVAFDFTSATTLDTERHAMVIARLRDAAQRLSVEGVLASPRYAPKPQPNVAPDYRTRLMGPWSPPVYTWSHARSPLDDRFRRPPNQPRPVRFPIRSR